MQEYKINKYGLDKRKKILKILPVFLLLMYGIMLLAILPTFNNSTEEKIGISILIFCSPVFVYILFFIMFNKKMKKMVDEKLVIADEYILIESPIHKIVLEFNDIEISENNNIIKTKIGKIDMLSYDNTNEIMDKLRNKKA